MKSSISNMPLSSYPLRMHAGGQPFPRPYFYLLRTYSLHLSLTGSILALPLRDGAYCLREWMVRSSAKKLHAGGSWRRECEGRIGSGWRWRSVVGVGWHGMAWHGKVGIRHKDRWELGGEMYSPVELHFV